MSVPLRSMCLSSATNPSVLRASARAAEWGAAMATSSRAMAIVPARRSEPTIEPMTERVLVRRSIFAPVPMRPSVGS
jgi:hypothetical protein